MKISQFAKILGSKGGRERAKRLSSRRIRGIASSGGRARSESIRVAKRMEVNFCYVRAIDAMVKSPKVRFLKKPSNKLPDIHG